MLEDQPTSITLTLLDLAGIIALLLWGVHMVQTGVQRAFGAGLRAFLSHRLQNRLSAFIAGLTITAVLQSSTATGLMVTGFARQGLVRGQRHTQIPSRFLQDISRQLLQRHTPRRRAGSNPQLNLFKQDSL